jgi:hypothetical protein
VFELLCQEPLNIPGLKMSSIGRSCRVERQKAPSLATFPPCGKRLYEIFTPRAMLLTPFLRWVCNNPMEAKRRTRHGHFMVDCGDGVFRRLFGPDRSFGKIAYGGLSMDWTVVLSLIVAAVLVAYLTAALLKPEIFS